MTPKIESSIWQNPSHKYSEKVILFLFSLWVQSVMSTVRIWSLRQRFCLSSLFPFWKQYHFRWTIPASGHPPVQNKAALLLTQSIIIIKLNLIRNTLRRSTRITCTSSRSGNIVKIKKKKNYKRNAASCRTMEKIVLQLQLKTNHSWRSINNRNRQKEFIELHPNSEVRLKI